MRKLWILLFAVVVVNAQAANRVKISNITPAVTVDTSGIFLYNSALGTFVVSPTQMAELLDGMFVELKASTLTVDGTASVNSLVADATIEGTTLVGASITSTGSITAVTLFGVGSSLTFTSLIVDGTITAATFAGDGSLLTGIIATSAITASSPLVASGTNLSIPAAGHASSGYLPSASWTFFFNKSATPHLHIESDINDLVHNATPHPHNESQINDMTKSWTDDGGSIFPTNANRIVSTTNSVYIVMVTAYFEDGVAFGTSEILETSQIEIVVPPNQNIHITAKNRNMFLGTLHFEQIPAITNTSVINFVVDASSQPDTHVTKTHMKMTGIAPGEIIHVHDVVIETQDAVGGIAEILSVDRLGSNPNVKLHIINAGAGVEVIHQALGIFEDIEQGFIENGGFTDSTSDFNSDSSNVTIFASDNDYIYIGDDNDFSEIEIILASESSKNILAIFQYSTGGGGWMTFTPNDSTTGMLQNGVISWSVDDLVGSAANVVNGATKKYIRVQTTRNGSFTRPVEKLIQIAATTDLGWDQNGNITIKSIGEDSATKISFATANQIVVKVDGIDSATYTATVIQQVTTAFQNLAYFPVHHNGSKSGTFSINWGPSNKQDVTLTGDAAIVMATLPDEVKSFNGVLEIIQDVASGHNLSYDADILWPNGATHTIGDVSYSILSFFYNETRWFGEGADFQ